MTFSMKKNKLFLVSLLIIIGSETFAQIFTAETGEIFIGEPKGNYFGALKILSGVLKKNEAIEIYAETGRKFTVLVKKISNNDGIEITEAKAGQTINVDLFTNDDAQSGNDYLRAGYKIYLKGFKTTVNNAVTSNITTKVDFTANLNGKPFKAAKVYKGALFYRKGMKNFAYDKPFIQLSFKSTDAIDNRILLFHIYNPKESVAKYDASVLEVNFSGSIDGTKENTKVYGFKAGSGTNFSVEITSWQRISVSKAIISGKIRGKMRELLTFEKKGNINIENGVFENIEVEIFNELYDMKDIIRK